MYKVKHEITHYMWSVETKDELLNELDILNARQKKRRVNDRVEIQYISEDGEIQQTMYLELPIFDSIDDALTELKEPTKVKRKKKWLFPWGKSRKNVEEKSREIKSSTEEDSSDLQNVVAVNEDVRDVIDIENTDATDSNENQDNLQVKEDLSIQKDEREDNSEYKDTDNQSLEDDSNTYTEQNQQNITEYVDNKNDIVNIDDTDMNEFIEDNDSVVLSRSVDQAYEKKEKFSQEIQYAIPRTSKSLSTYDLQLEFAERIESEVTKIDEKIAQLTAQKRNHLKLLKTLQNVDLIE